MLKAFLPLMALALFSSCASRQAPSPPLATYSSPSELEAQKPVTMPERRSPVTVDEVVTTPEQTQNVENEPKETDIEAIEDQELTKQEEVQAPSRYGKLYKGKASYYHDGLIGRLTANGERYRAQRATCAHKKLPFGTRLEVRDPQTQLSVICRVNDRGPFVKGRIIDLSKSLAKEMGMMDKGVIEVEVRVLLDED